MEKVIVFVDFDGTITSEETLVGALKIIVSDEEFQRKNKDLLNQKATISQVLHEAFEKTPSIKMAEIIDYVQTVSIRPGFEAFLDYLNERKIPMVVISGGLRQMLDAKIGQYKDRILNTHCVEVDTTHELMILKSDYDDGNELLKKTEIMKQYDYKMAICIGDSHTDIKIAMASDIVFARDFLADYLKAKEKPFYQWNDFFDIKNTLEKILEPE